MKHRATIHDVAREAGCSTASVSRALNGDARVSPGLMDRVRAAAARLDFRINAIGRALQTRRSGVVGVMIPSIANPVFAEAVAGAGDVAAGRGRQLLLASSDYDPQKELEAVATLIDRSVDGLLLTVADADDSPALEAALAADVPTVLMFNDACARAPVATSNTYAAGAAVGKLLVEAGRRHVGFVAGRFATSDRSRRRFEGLRDALIGLEAPAPMLVEVDYGATDHRDALSGLFGDDPAIDALVCSNDMLALSVIADLRALKRRCPEDVAVVGFDGLALGRMVEPSLATVATPNRAMGREAARLLLNLIDETGGPTVETVWLPFEIRPGGSLAPVRPDPATRARPRAARRPTPEPATSAPAFATGPETDR
jgi:DNA-binding LacI/PurR family transcriptional regulator